MPVLEEKTVPAYFTAAWDTAGKLTIQQLQQQTVLFRDGVPDPEGKLLPIELIQAPHANDKTTPGLLAVALSAVASGQLLAVAKMEADHAAACADYEARLSAKAAEAEALTATITAKDADLATKDQTAQTLLAQLADIQAKLDAEIRANGVTQVSDPTPPAEPPAVAPVADATPPTPAPAG